MLFPADDDDKAMARQLGYDVSVDPDKPTHFQWTLTEFGVVRGGCGLAVSQGADEPLPTEEAAWQDVMYLIAEAVLDTHGVELAAWAVLPTDKRHRLAVQAFSYEN